eukprot:IDg18377t1
MDAVVRVAGSSPFPSIVRNPCICSGELPASAMQYSFELHCTVCDTSVLYVNNVHSTPTCNILSTHRPAMHCHDRVLRTRGIAGRPPSERPALHCCAARRLAAAHRLPLPPKMIPPGRDGEQTENTLPEEEALIHVAKLPPPASHPSELWAAPDAALTGNIVLPDGRGTHALETVVTALAAALEPHLRSVSRVAIWRVSPCVALALTPVLRRLRVAPAWLNDRWSLRDASRALEIVAAPVVLQGVHTA